MRIARAKELCPNLVVMPYEFERYSAVALDVYRILHRVTPHVMGVSVDEAYVDATGCQGGAKVGLSLPGVRLDTSCALLGFSLPDQIGYIMRLSRVVTPGSEWLHRHQLVF
jgi:nucleotidyltransferase/DNA polymerase involved in DNA repair